MLVVAGHGTSLLIFENKVPFRYTVVPVQRGTLLHKTGLNNRFIIPQRLERLGWQIINPLFDAITHQSLAGGADQLVRHLTHGTAGMETG